uniref:Uncharacterized protein n=1 Tax=Romanomermis culicivorax TaxID=13658 RepID=A0A915L7M7_ROMCU
MTATPGIEPILPNVEPEPKNFFYPAVLDKTLHPTVLKVLNMTNAEFARRYCQIHKKANESTLLKLMNAKVSFYRWGGADLMRAKDSKGQEKMVIIEMNSCPSGNKSVPFKEWGFEGFSRVMANAFVPLLAQKNLPVGGSLAVFYDVAKQRKESLAYATMLAKMTGEIVYLADVGYGIELPTFLKWSPEGVCSLEIEPGTWKEMRAVFRYVTRRPWVKLPLLTKTVVLNPVIACLAGGRNKLLAAKAYEIFNDKYDKSDGLCIHFPLSITDVTKQSIPKYAEKMNYQLVVKITDLENIRSLVMLLKCG